MNHRLTAIAAFAGALSVAIGAFGAHGLKNFVAPEQLAVFETGVRYQFYHTLAMLAVSILLSSTGEKKFRLAFYFFAAGIILFSGSLYLLSIKELIGLSGLNRIGVVTPVGGLCFIAGWVVMGVGAFLTKVRA